MIILPVIWNLLFWVLLAFGVIIIVVFIRQQVYIRDGLEDKRWLQPKEVSIL